MKSFKRFALAVISVCFILPLISGKNYGAQAATQGFTKTDASYAALRLKSAPAVIADIADMRNVKYVSADKNPAATNAFIRLNGEGNVTDDRGNDMESLTDFFGELHKSVIPNIYVADDNALNAFLSYASSHTKFNDASVISSDANILKKARASAARFRRILDASNVAFDGADIAKTAVESGALAVVLNGETATKSDVDYLQKRMIGVWVKLDGNDRFAAYKGIACGAFGLITDGDPAVVASVYNDFETINKYTISRTPLNVAHRGLPFDYNENSLEGFEAAINAGATHLEIDAHLTKDGKIVMMHDGNIDRTTNGTGAISSMTLEELRQYKIIKNYGEVITGTESVIPTVDEVFELCKDKDIIIFFEIKTTNSKLVTELKSKIEEYGMQNKIVIIAFEDSVLKNVREALPYIRALDLKDRKQTVAETVVNFCEKDISADMSNGNTSIMRDLLERGFVPGAWTYSNKSSFKSAVNEGVYAITNNDAAGCAEVYAEVAFDELPAVKKSDLKSGFTIKGAVKAYNGDKKQVNCTLLAYRDSGSYAEAVFLASTSDWNIVSETVRLEYVKGGCKAEAAFPAATAAFVVTALAIYLKKIGGKNKC